MSNRPLSQTERENLRADIAAAKRRKALAEREAARVAALTADGHEAAAMRVALRYTSKSLAAQTRGRTLADAERRFAAAAERIAAAQGCELRTAKRAIQIACRVPRWAIARALPAVAAGATLADALAAVAAARNAECQAIEDAMGPGFRELLADLAQLAR
jgi:hypothetical protein